MNTDRHGLFTAARTAARRRRAFRTAAPRSRCEPLPRAALENLALAGAACAAVALIVVVVLRRDSDRPVMPPLVADLQPTPEIYNSPAFDRLLGRPAQFTELTVSRNEQSASVVELETANDKVRIYQIE